MVIIGNTWGFTDEMHKANRDKSREFFSLVKKYAPTKTSKVELKNTLSIQGKKNEMSSSADEIRKFKKLFDEGIINQDEFDEAKKKLL